MVDIEGYPEGSETFISVDDVVLSLMGSPSLFVGVVSTDVVVTACQEIVAGNFDFDATISYGGEVFNVPLDLSATGGCGNPLEPALV